MEKDDRSEGEGPLLGAEAEKLKDASSGCWYSGARLGLRGGRQWAGVAAVKSGRLGLGGCQWTGEVVESAW